MNAVINCAFSIINPMIWSLSCFLGDKGCMEKATRLFQTRIHIETPLYDRNVGYRDVNCIGIANSLLESEWNTIFERYYKLLTKKESESQRLDLLYSLSCSRNVSLLERLLDFIIENKVDPQHLNRGQFYYTIAYVDSHPASNYTAWKWLKINSAKVDKRYRMSSGSSTFYLKRLAYNMKTREQRQEVLDYFDEYPFAAKYLKSTILDIIDRNIRWMDKNLPCIGKWLEDNAP